MQKKSKKTEFLKKIMSNSKNISLAEVIEKEELWFGDCYYSLVEDINAHKTGKVEAKDLLNFYKLVYDNWYDYLSIMCDNFIPEAKEKVKTFLSLEKYKKENMTNERCHDYFHYEFNNFFEGLNIRPIQAQMGDPLITENGRVLSDFLHCKPFGRPKTNCRLYLNIKSQNLIALGESLIKKCFDKRLMLYFKFFTEDHRGDTFLIYTNYGSVQAMIDVLHEIKKEKPYIFEGCEKISPLLLNIDNFIGFGEEPEYKHSSFNAERAYAIDDFVAEVIAQKRKDIANFKGQIQTSQGQTLNLKEYLRYRIDITIKETLRKRLSSYEEEYRKNPKRFTDYNIKYMNITRKLKQDFESGTNDFCNRELDRLTDFYLKLLKEGKAVQWISIEIPTKDYALFPNEKKERLDKYMAKDGCLYFKYYFNCTNESIQKKLFSLFNVKFTDKDLKPYLEKYHISPKCIALNIETERILEESGRNEIE